MCTVVPGGVVFVVKTVGLRHCPSTHRLKMVFVTCSTLLRNSVASCSPANLHRNPFVFHSISSSSTSSNIYHKLSERCFAFMFTSPGGLHIPRITQLVKICSPVHFSPTRRHRFLLQQLCELSGCPVLTFAVPTQCVYFKMCCSSPRSNSQ